MAPVARSAFATTDPEEALPVLAPIYPQIDLSPSPQGGFRFDLESTDTGLFSTVRYRLTSPNSASTADGAGSLSIAHLLGGRMHLSDGRTEVDMSKPFLAPPRAFGASWDDVKIGGGRPGPDGGRALRPATSRVGRFPARLHRRQPDRFADVAVLDRHRWHAESGPAAR